MKRKEPAIILNEDFLMWRWFTNPKVLHVFTWLLLEANEEKTCFEKEVIPRGSLVTKNEIIADKCGMTIQNVRTALANLERTGDITRERKSHYQIITIPDFESYKEH